LVLEIGTRQPHADEVFYPDIDLRLAKGRAGFFHNDGSPYADTRPRTPDEDK
jgi:uncharacterized cupin superfamily protein